LVFHPEALAFNDDGVGMMQQPIQDRGGQGAVMVEDRGPLLAGAVGGNDERSLFIAEADHLEEQIGAPTDHYEEKETDVAISTQLLELLHNDACDIVVLVTGDTDLAPVVRAAKRMYPTQEVCFAFPYKRKNNELAALVHTYFNIKKERYATHQFPDTVLLPDGRQLNKPLTW